MRTALKISVCVLIGMMIFCTMGVYAGEDRPTPLADVRVIAPNGGEVWYVGVEYEIGWGLINVSGGQYPTRISYSVSGFNGTFMVIANTTSRRMYNSFRWVVPDTPTKDAVVKVEVMIGNTTISDMSDGVFEIRSLPPGDSVVVISPNGGEVFSVNQRVGISWVVNISNPPPYQVLVQYSTAGPNGPWNIIANLTQQQKQGVFNWVVPNTPTKDAYIQVIELSTNESDMSDGPFEITSPPQPSVKVITPNGGEVLQAGIGYNVTWELTIPQGQNIPTTIFYSITGVNGTYTPIVNLPSNRGINGFTWIVNNTPTKEGAIKVVVRPMGITLEDTSDNVFEIAGAPPNQTLERVIIIPKSATVEAGKSLQFQAKAFDRSGADITPKVKFTWEVGGNIGTISPTGLFTAQQPGYGSVKVTGEYLGDTRVDIANVTVIPAGSNVTLAYVVIQPRSATIPLGKTLQFTAKAYDQYGNEIPPQSMSYTWKVNNSIGVIDQAGVFTAKNTGDGMVIVTGMYAGVTKEDSAHVTVVPENTTIELANVVISPKSVTVQLGNTQRFIARAVVQFGNDIPPAMVRFAWSVMGGIGSVDPGGLFTAQNTGNGSVIVEGTMNSITKSDSARVTVVPQNTTITLTRVVIEPRGATLKPGERVRFSGKAYDQFNNEIPQGVTFTWGVIGNIGEIDPFGMFTAKNPGSGSVVLTGTQGTISRTDSVPVNVTAPGKIRVVIEPSDIALTVGSTQQFTARVYDADGKEVTQGVSLQWSVNGTIGTINETGFFTAKYEGKGYIMVRAEYNGMVATNTTSVTVKSSEGTGTGTGLSGSQIGLIAGVAAAAAISTLLALLWFRRRRTRKVGADTDTGSPVRENKKGENP